MTPLRIMHITQSYPPMVSGAAQVSQRLAEGLAQRGHDVVVLTASDTGRETVTARPHFKLRRLASLRNPFRVGQRFVLWPGNAVQAEIKAFQPDPGWRQRLPGSTDFGKLQAGDGMVCPTTQTARL